MRRSLGLVVVVALTLMVIPAVAGAPLAHGTNADATLARFGVRTIQAPPAGVTPLEFDELSELLRFVRAVKSRGSVDLVVEDPFRSMKSLEITETCVHLRKTKSWVPFPTFNLWADVWIAGSGSFWEITDVHERVGLTGITTFNDLTDTWTYHRISTDRQSATIRGGGVVNHYLVFRGVFKLYSQPVSLSISYRL